MSVERQKSRIITRRYRVQVEFHHVDLMNVVHNVQYFKWFERGRLTIMNEVVPVSWGIENQIAAPVVSNFCEYLHTATYGDELVVTTRHRTLSRWEGKFGFDHSISNVKTKQEICRGRTEITVVDFKTNRIFKELPDLLQHRYRALA